MIWRRAAASLDSPGREVRAAYALRTGACPGSGGFVRVGSVCWRKPILRVRKKLRVVSCPRLSPGHRASRSPHSNAPVLSLLRSSARPPEVRTAPAPCTARWPRRAPRRGRRRPPARRVRAVGPQASARTWPSELP